MNPLLRLGRLAARAARGVAPGCARPDDAFAAERLRGAERAAYLAMDPRDRDHACRVARRLERDARDADAAWVRAALLHDVGKAGAGYRLWERVLVHVWTPPEGIVRRLPAGLGAAWRRQRDHAALGAERLRAAGVDPDVVELVARHHQPPGTDPALRALARADERS